MSLPSSTRRRRPFRRTLLALFVLALTSCGGSQSPSKVDDGVHAVPARPASPIPADDGEDNIEIRLSAGTDEAKEEDARARTVNGTRLTEAETKSLLARLPALDQKPGDATSFALRDASRPPPKTGETVKTPFPPDAPATPPPAAFAKNAPLKVLRFAPEGDVPVAPSLNVTFSKPMVAVTGVDDLSQERVPVKLTPEAPGRWRWLGTRTLTFDPAVRLPMATEFKAEIPAGTRATDGTVLAAAVRWTFRTPAPTVVSATPRGGAQPLRPSFFLSFDQRIDAAKVLEHVRVTAEGKRFAVAALSEADAEADPAIGELVRGMKRSEQGGRWLAFRTVEALPAAASVSYWVEPGTPSAEGPRKTEKLQGFEFRTYEPLKVTWRSCEPRPCQPGEGLHIGFNNPLDVASFDAASVRIAPALGDDARVAAEWQSISIQADTRPRTTYTVTLPATLRDTYGQMLGREQTLTFEVGPAEPLLTASGPMVLADPARAKPAYDVFSVNQKRLKVSLYRVAAADYPAYARYLTEAQRWEGNRTVWKTPPGKRVLDTTLTVKDAADELVETAVDLGPALTGGHGHAIAVVEPTNWPDERYKPRSFAWVQATKLGLDAFLDQQELTVWVTSLADGTPRAGVKVSVTPLGLAGTSNADGIVKFQLPRSAPGGMRMIVAQEGGDTAVLPEQLHHYGESGGWLRQDPTEGFAWHVFDDRGIYRPGEEVHLKGWVRRIGFAKHGDVGAFGGAGRRVSFEVNDAQGNGIGKGEAEVSSTGAFDFTFTVPKTPNLGSAYVRLAMRLASGEDTSFGHSIRVEEFRRPEYEVNVTPPTEPLFFGTHAVAKAKASYFAGGGLAGAPVRWTVTASATNFDPPNWDDFVFGEWRPWWWAVERGPRGGYGKGFPGLSAPSQTWTFDGRTDGAGEHLVRLDFDRVTPPRPVTVDLRAAVSDVNRQAWSGGGTMLVHAASSYVGLRAQRMFVGEGEPLRVDAALVDLDGKAAAGRAIVIRASRTEWVFENGAYVEKQADAEECAVTSAAEFATCTFQPKKGGQYRVTATARDAEGRASEASLTVWVAGGDVVPSRDLEQERVEIIPNKQEYAPGEKAELLVRVPFVPAEAVVSVRRAGVLSMERVRITSAAARIVVPIVDAHTPNVWVQVDAVGAKTRTDARGKPLAGAPKRPAYASGTLNLAVPPKHRALQVTATPAATRLAPGAATEVKVRVSGADGKPLPKAEVTVVAVDEAVWALTGHSIVDPTGSFYPERDAGTTDLRARMYAVLAATENLRTAGGGAAQEKSARARGLATDMMADGAMAPAASAAREESLESVADAPGAEPKPVQPRTNFNPLAVFAPVVFTDAGGNARVSFTLPDNLTRYRVVAIATDGAKRFGKGESAITARKPLMVRPSAPRFLNFGDRFALPVVLQNQTDAPMKVRLAARGTNLAFTQGQGRLVEVPAGDRVEVQLPAAAGMPGTARLQVMAASGAASDAAELSLPVWTPATTEAFATYGELDKGAVAQPVRAPADAVLEFGGLEVSTSSTQLQALTDAFVYLQTYPYECAEQIASRMLSVAALRTVLSEFRAEGLPPAAAIEAQMEKDLARLASLQHPSGGFSFWPATRPWPFVSVHVTHALAQAKAEGYAVPEHTLSRALEHIARIEDHIDPDYGPDVRRALVAYALYVRMVAGVRDTAKARAVLAEVPLDKHPVEVLGWLLSVLAGDAASAADRARVVRHLQNRTVETAGGATITSQWKDGAHLILASDLRDDAIVLDALMRESGKSDVIPKLVRGLLGHTKRGRWASTQENVFVLLALRNYFKKYEAVTPDFVARLWLGEGFAGEHAFRGRTTETHLVEVPMAAVAKAGKANLTVAKDGPGRLYYRVGLRYAPKSLDLAALDAGFAVERSYEGVDRPEDVVRMDDGSWKVRAGARVRVRVKMVAEARRDHVALVDPLPAGFEAVNSSLANAEPVPTPPPGEAVPMGMPRSVRGRSAAFGGDYLYPGPWWGRWYEHENLRDERAEAFTSYLPAGVYEYVYVAKATTPGSFVVPPAKAEEMYAPETFGRSASTKVTVVP